MLVTGCRLRQTLSQGISNILRPCVFDKFHGSVPHHVAQEMYSYVHVTRAFAICGVSLEDVRCVIFPDPCRAML